MMTIEEKMCERAEEREWESRYNAETERDELWCHTLCGDDPSERDVAYAHKGVFDDAARYFQNRREDMLGCYCSATEFWVVNKIAKILAFDFSFLYDSFWWNGKAEAPEEAQINSQPECGTLAMDNDKRRVCQVMREYIVTAGAQAKAIGSDAYPLWRKLLTDFAFIYREFRGCETPEQDTRAFLVRMQEAAQMTWADFAFRREMENLSRQTSNSRKNGAKNKVRGGKRDNLSK